MHLQSADSLDFEAVLDQFAAYAFSAKTAAHIRNADIFTSPLAIKEPLGQTAEMARFIQNGHDLSLGGLSDIRPLLEAARKGITLLPSELLSVSLFLSAAASASKAFDEKEYPLLEQIAATLSPLDGLARSIDAAIDLSGQIRPDASTKLESLERSLISAKADLGAAARRFIKANSSSLVDSVAVSMGSRTCVLVKAADKYKFGGMVHGLSQSGAACYLEPGVLVSFNNKVAELGMEIEEEKKRICQELTRKVKKDAIALESNEESLEIIDLAWAKAKWMLAHDGSVPVLMPESHELALKHAVHPLLDPATAVANDYRLRKGEEVMMITGSNTGGKTVTLKTIGLCVLLGHCGFPIPAHEARFGWFERFFFDIGDRQSIESSLSTFSSHIERIASLLDQADGQTFALLDEIGSGTDPKEGSALAQAVLEELIERGSVVLTSTHYEQVKTFGKTNPSIQVGSVEFDATTLTPTYRYLPRVSGSSYAFDIASRYGLSSSVIERARVLEEQNASAAGKQLAILEKQQAQVQKQKDRFDALIADAHRLQKEAENKEKQWTEKKQRLDLDYEKQLEDMLYEKREEAKEILRDLRKSGGKAGHEQIEQMGKLSTLRGESIQEEQSSEKRDWKAGDYVRIASLNNHGEIVSVRKDKAMVMVNGRKVNVSTDQLTLMKKPGQPAKPKRSSSRPVSFAPFPMELNLIGMHVDEALSELEHYIDQAVYHNVKNVRIIHGMGTGALRNAVWSNLKKHPQVKHLSAGGPADGGLGVTLVELK